MRTLSAGELLQVWETSREHHPVDQALAILAMVFPGTTQAELAALSLGQRDAYLLDVHAQTFGPRLDALVDCPHCQETLELAFQIDDIRTRPPDQPAEAEYLVGGYKLRFRLPNSLDVAQIARRATDLDLTAARETLVRRCVLEASYGDQAIAPDDLPEDVSAELARRMAETDPQAEVLLNLTCPTCGYAWSALFDIIIFVWARVRGQAQRLLLDVHTLARAYGWREADILAMSAARRRCYMDMLGF